MIFSIPTPANINQARRQANCFSRAQKMEQDGYKIEVMTGCLAGDWYKVTNPEGTSYNVDPLTGKCNCPDFKKHEDFCKHQMFVNIWEAKQEVLRDEAMCAEFEAQEAAAEHPTFGTDPYFDVDLRYVIR